MNDFCCLITTELPSGVVTLSISGLLGGEDSGQRAKDVLRDEHQAVSILHGAVEDVQEPGVAVVLQPGHADLQHLGYSLLPPAPAHPVRASLLVHVQADLLPERYKCINSELSRKDIFFG